MNDLTGMDLRDSWRATGDPDTIAIVEKIMDVAGVTWEHVAFLARRSGRAARDTRGCPVDIAAETAFASGFLCGLTKGFGAGADAEDDDS